MALLSVVIPSYNEESNIRHTAEVLSTLLQREQINYELLFVSDGSKDQTFPLIRRLAEEDGPGTRRAVQPEFRQRSCDFCRSPAG